VAVVPPAAAAPVNDRPPPGLGWAVPLVHSDELIPLRTLPAAVVIPTAAMIPAAPTVIPIVPAAIRVLASRATIPAVRKRGRRKHGSADDHRGGNSRGTKPRAQ
jgi:hypothetical protein